MTIPSKADIVNITFKFYSDNYGDSLRNTIIDAASIGKTKVTYRVEQSDAFGFAQARGMLAYLYAFGYTVDYHRNYNENSHEYLISWVLDNQQE